MELFIWMSLSRILLLLRRNDTSKTVSPHHSQVVVNTERNSQTRVALKRISPKHDVLHDVKMTPPRLPRSDSGSFSGKEKERKLDRMLEGHARCTVIVESE